MGILTEDMKRVVREQRLGFIATVCPDGTPNLSPKGTTTVWDDDHLVFAHLCSPGTVENLRHNPAIEINVVDQIVRKGYRFKGTARVLTAGPLFEEIRASYQPGRWSAGRVHGPTAEAPQNGEAVRADVAGRIEAVVLVKVERALALISPAYDGGATEADVSARWAAYFNALRETQRISR